MAANGNLLKGEVTESPSNEKKDVDELLRRLILALLSECKDETETGAPS